MSKTFFVTGTDTHVGKTVIGAGLLQALNEQGMSTVGLKPVSAGAESIEGKLFNEDALLLQKSASIHLPYDVVNPYVFAEPIAPHIAAEKNARHIDLQGCLSSYETALASNADIVVIEGAGGWLVPVSRDKSLADLAVAVNASVILVVGVKLGCISHALLTATAIRVSGLELAGWVANKMYCDVEQIEANIQSLKDRLGAPLLGEIPYMQSPEVQKVAPCLDASLLLSLCK